MQVFVGYKLDVLDDVVDEFPNGLVISIDAVALDDVSPFCAVDAAKVRFVVDLGAIQLFVEGHFVDLDFLFMPGLSR